MSIKILKDLGDNKYEVEIHPSEGVKGLREVQFGVVHDYIHFDDASFLHNADGSTRVSSPIVWHSTHIPIRTFVNLCLPKIIAHKYCQPEHLKDRAYDEDDRYNTPPKYKKGDSYPAYSYQNVATYYWENGVRMVAIILRGESTHSVMTAKMFDLMKTKMDFLNL